MSYIGSRNQNTNLKSKDAKYWYDIFIVGTKQFNLMRQVWDIIKQNKTEINVKMKTTRYNGALLDLISGTMCIAETLKTKNV